MPPLVVPENVILKPTNVLTASAHLLLQLVVPLSVPTPLVKPTSVKSLELPHSVLVQLFVIVPKKWIPSILVKSMMVVVTLPILLDVKSELETVPKNLKMVLYKFLETLENVVLSFKTQPTLTAVLFKPRPVQTMILVPLLPVIQLMVFVNLVHLDV